MDKNSEHQFEGVNQGWHQFYAAKFCGGDEDCAEALRTLLTKLIERKSYKGFCADFAKNLNLIVSQVVSNETYYDNLDERIAIAKASLVSDYSGFIRYQKTRILYQTKLIPTFEHMIGVKVQGLLESGNTTVLVDGVGVEVPEVKQHIVKHMEDKDEKYKLQDDLPTMLISEGSSKSYEFVEGKPQNEIKVEGTDGESYVKFIQEFPKEIVMKKYVETLKSTMSSKSSEIPIVVSDDGKKVFKNVVLPKVAKYFLDANHFFNCNDIGNAINLRFGVDGQDKTGAQLKREFLEAISRKGEKPKAVLCNATWLDRNVFDHILDYIPLYTGFKGAAWILVYAPGGKVCNNLEVYKSVMNMVQKMAKFYGLWIRSGCKVTGMQGYLEGALKLDKDKNVYGQAVHFNVKEWCTPLIIESFKEGTLFTLSGEQNIFGTSTEDEDLSKLVTRDKEFVYERTKIQDRDEDIEGTSPHHRLKKGSSGLKHALDKKRLSKIKRKKEKEKEKLDRKKSIKDRDKRGKRKEKEEEEDDDDESSISESDEEEPGGDSSEDREDDQDEQIYEIGGVFN